MLIFSDGDQPQLDQRRYRSRMYRPVPERHVDVYDVEWKLRAARDFWKFGDYHQSERIVRGAREHGNRQLLSEHDRSGGPWPRIRFRLEPLLQQPGRHPRPAGPTVESHLQQSLNPGFGIGNRADLRSIR